MKKPIHKTNLPDLFSKYILKPYTECYKQDQASLSTVIKRLIMKSVGPEITKRIKQALTQLGLRRRVVTKQRSLWKFCNAALETYDSKCQNINEVAH